ncbi:MAG TPA: HAD family phosphatase [Anaerolineae bacterium]|nr:HAD family phosphatase [Anaerolineae bacterium]
MEEKRKLKAVVFDMGGVLLKTVDPLPREQLAHRYSMTRPELEALVFGSGFSHQAEVGSISREQYWYEVATAVGEDNMNMPEFVENFFSGDSLDKQLMQFACSLKPRYRLGLLSNAFIDARKDLHTRFGFLDIFDVSIFSYEVKVRKPDPRIFKIMLDRLGIQPEETVFIDDLSVNVESACKVGLQAIQFKSREQVLEELSALLSQV